MSDNIKQLGVDVGKYNIRYRRCEAGMHGGFDKTYGSKLYANYLETKSQMKDVMAHEVVYTYGYLRFKVDWVAQDLRPVACTENSVVRCRMNRRSG